MTDLPLYKEAVNTPPGEGGHAGLLHEKFFNCWSMDLAAGRVEIRPPKDREQPGGKMVWIKEIAKHPAGDTKLLRQAAYRQEKLVEALGGTVCDGKLLSPFVTGLGYEHPIENGFVWHPTLGAPFLPASGVKGLIRAWVRDYEEQDEADLNRIFGEAETGVGDWIFFDALPLEPVKLTAEVMTPHDGGWRVPEELSVTPSDWVSPNPIPFLAVKPGARFQFAFAPRSRRLESEQKKSDAEQLLQWLKDALDYLGAGAKTAVGFGRFSS